MGAEFLPSKIEDLEYPIKEEEHDPETTSNAIPRQQISNKLTIRKAGRVAALPGSTPSASTTHEPADGKRAKLTRRSHTKSRKGCGNCKHRRIKVPILLFLTTAYSLLCS